MAGTLWALALRYLDARRRAVGACQAKPPSKRPGQRPPGRSSESALGHRLASEPEMLERIVAVRPHSVAVLLTRDQPPQLKLPGEQLRPSLVPKLRPIQVVVVSTAVTHLDVTVKDLVSLDGYPIDRIKIRLAVQLSDTDRYATLVEMVANHAADLDDHLLRLVQHEVTTSLQRAVRMNRLADLRRQTLQRVLEDRWLPRGLAGGALIRRSFTVLDAPSPPAEPDTATADTRPAATHRGGAAVTVQPATARSHAGHCHSIPARPHHGRPIAPGVARSCRPGAVRASPGPRRATASR